MEKLLKYNENNCHLSHGNNYRISAHSSYGDMNHQPYDNNNRPNRPRSYGNFNHRKIDEINYCPFHGDIDHWTYYDKKKLVIYHMVKITTNLINILIQNMVI